MRMIWHIQLGNMYGKALPDDMYDVCMTLMIPQMRNVCCMCAVQLRDNYDNIHNYVHIRIGQSLSRIGWTGVMMVL